MNGNVAGDELMPLLINNVYGPAGTVVGIVNTRTVPSGETYVLFACKLELLVPKYTEADVVNPEPNKTTEVASSAYAEDGTTELTTNCGATIVNQPLTGSVESAPDETPSNRIRYVPAVTF